MAEYIWIDSEGGVRSKSRVCHLPAAPDVGVVVEGFIVSLTACLAQTDSGRKVWRPVHARRTPNSTCTPCRNPTRSCRDQPFS